MWPRITGVLLLMLVCPAALAQHEHHGHGGMIMDASGMVMNQNHDTLPAGCTAIAEDVAFEIEGGAEFATDHPGTMFGYSQHRFEVAPCTRITVTFHNRDAVRHHWMVHGLPRTLHPGGMFHLEAAGGASQTGTFIVPGNEATYLVHCDVAQHMEKGMKGQIIVGGGDGQLWAVPGETAAFIRADYLPRGTLWMVLGMLLVSWLLLGFLLRR